MATYLHTVVVFVALCLFAFEIYATKNTGGRLACACCVRQAAGAVPLRLRGNALHDRGGHSRTAHPTSRPVCHPHMHCCPISAGLGSPASVWTHLTDISTLGGAFKGVSSAGSCRSHAMQGRARFPARPPHLGPPCAAC